MSDVQVTPALLARIVEDASAAPAGPWRFGLASRRISSGRWHLATVAGMGLAAAQIGRFIAEVNPETVLALVRRINELEQRLNSDAARTAAMQRPFPSWGDLERAGYSSLRPRPWTGTVTAALAVLWCDMLFG